MIHAVLSIIFCVVVTFFRLPVWTYLWPAVFYISREFAQSEYRYVLRHCHGSFAQMPIFAGFYAENWNMKSLLDWILPLLVSLLFWYGSKYISRIKKG